MSDIETPDVFKDHLTTIDELRAHVPEPALKITYAKVQDALDEHCRSLIAAAPYLVMATADRNGRCDASPRGGPPGFVKALDDNCLLIPELSGNRRADSLRNIIENPWIGLFFLIPGYEDILRVNGRAYVVVAPDVLEQACVEDVQPTVGIGVRVVEAYMHCAKSAKRASLWDSAGWPDQGGIASMAKILRDHTRGGVGDGSVEAIEAILEESYTQRLFKSGW